MGEANVGVIVPELFKLIPMYSFTTEVAIANAFIPPADVAKTLQYDESVHEAGRAFPHLPLVEQVPYSCQDFLGVFDDCGDFIPLALEDLEINHDPELRAAEVMSESKERGEGYLELSCSQFVLIMDDLIAPLLGLQQGSPVALVYSNGC
jgi:hypothetical protein